MKKDWQEYRDTGMLGVYHPEDAVLHKNEHGSVTADFEDTEHRREQDTLVRERRMLIGGKCFLITSVFPGEPTSTPTDKLLALIDSELEKEAHSA